MNVHTNPELMATATLPPAGSNPMESLGKRALFASLTLKAWTGRKLDKRVSDEAIKAHHAGREAGRFNKSLIARQAFSDIVSIDNEIRSFFYAQTLPWHDNGFRALAARRVIQFDAKMTELEFRRAAAVESLVQNFAAYVIEAESLLGSMFNADDYPPADSIRGRFVMRWHICQASELPKSDDDVRVAVGVAERDIIRKHAERSARAALDNMTGETFKRIAEAVARMVDRLGAYKPASEPGTRPTGVFRDSLVENVRELVELLPDLNMTGDAKITELTRRMQELGKHDPDALRQSPDLRQSTKAAAESILAEVADYI